MADHARTQCRDAAAALLASLTTTTTHCFAGRPQTRPLQDSELPGLLVYTNDEDSNLITLSPMGQRRKERSCQLVVHGFARGTGDIDKTLDTIAKEVEAALEASPTLGGKAKDCYHVNTTKRDDPESEQPTWEIVLTFTCEYHTRESVPDTPLA